jgi:transposase
MAKYKKYNYAQMVMIPVSLEDQLLPGTLEYTIHEAVESKVDLSVFVLKYNNDETGAPAHDPKLLLKVILLAFSRGMTGSRKIEKACRENITFLALSCGMAPDHSTIAHFISSLHEEIIHLFRDILLYCEELNLLGGTHFSLDGCPEGDAFGTNFLPMPQSNGAALLKTSKQNATNWRRRSEQ